MLLLYKLKIKNQIYFKKILFKRILLAPRGEFNIGALGLSKFKKKIYIKTAIFFNLYKSII